MCTCRVSKEKADAMNKEKPYTKINIYEEDPSSLIQLLNPQPMTEKEMQELVESLADIRNNE